MFVSLLLRDFDVEFLVRNIAEDTVRDVFTNAIRVAVHAGINAVRVCKCA